LSRRYATGRGEPPTRETLFGRSWRFAPSGISLPGIHLWHGGLDREVPVSAAQALAAELPSCTARFCSDDGHTSLIGNYADEIVSSLTAA
jgi:hypothetical protein